MILANLIEIGIFLIKSNKISVVIIHFISTYLNRKPTASTNEVAGDAKN